MAAYNLSLDERYTFIRKAGSGTYGTTWIAEDRVTRDLVAVKSISKRRTTRADFKRELKYGRMVSSHPNVITTHNTGFETQTSYVMVQDFAEGGDLFDAIQPEVGLTEKTAKKFICQIAEAVDHIHSQNLVHRDIKPENIVLGDRNGTFVQMIDFGMTLRAGTHVSRVSGSIPYTSPEICNASDETGFFVESSCDVWSVGVLLFCMLTGSFPWEQATLSDPNYLKFVQWQQGLAIKPPKMWQKFSPKLLSLFNHLLAASPLDRCDITEILKYSNESWLVQPSSPPATSSCHWYTDSELSVYSSSHVTAF